MGRFLLHLVAIIVVVFSFAKTVQAANSQVEIRSDGVFLFNSKPYFPLCFRGPLWYTASSSEWQSIANYGFNCTTDQVAMGIVNSTWTPWNFSQTPAWEVEQANKNPGHLFYFVMDDVSGPDALNTSQKEHMKNISLLDPNHPMWTNSQWRGGFPLSQLAEFGRQTGTSVYSTYDFNSLGQGWLATGMWGAANIYPGPGKGSVLSYISAYHTYLLGELSIFDRYYSAIDAIVGGAKGLIFFADCAGDDVTSYGGCDWPHYAQTQTFRHVLLIGQVLRNSMPGLTGGQKCRGCP